MAHETPGTSKRTSSQDVQISTAQSFDLQSWQGLTEVLKIARESDLSDSAYAEFRNLVLRYAQSKGDQELRKQIGTYIEQFHDAGSVSVHRSDTTPHAAQKQASPKPEKLTQEPDQSAKQEPKPVSQGPKEKPKENPEEKPKQKTVQIPKRENTPTQTIERPTSGAQQSVDGDGVVARPRNTFHARTRKRPQFSAPNLTSEKREPSAREAHTTPVSEYVAEPVSPEPAAVHADAVHDDADTAPTSAEISGPGERKNAHEPQSGTQQAPEPATPPTVPQPETAPVSDGGASIEEYKARIRAIKRTVNERAKNPIMLVDDGNPIGRNYMQALLQAMKATAGGMPGSLSAKMEALESAYQELVAYVETHDDGALQPDTGGTSGYTSEQTTGADAEDTKAPHREKEEEPHDVRPAQPTAPETPPERPETHSSGKPEPIPAVKSKQAQNAPQGESRHEFPLESTIRHKSEKEGVNEKRSQKIDTEKSTEKNKAEEEHITKAGAPKKKTLLENDAVSDELYTVTTKKANSIGPQPEKGPISSAPWAAPIPTAEKRNIFSRVKTPSAPQHTQSTHQPSVGRIHEEEKTGDHSTTPDQTESKKPAIRADTPEAPAAEPHAMPNLASSFNEHSDRDDTPHGSDVQEHKEHEIKNISDMVDRVTSAQSELSLPEVTQGLNELLEEWSLFKQNGILGMGPSGKDHPLYKQLSVLTMAEVMLGRWEGASPEKIRILKDYTNAWRNEQGISYNRGETFEHYLRRVVQRVLKRQRVST